MSKVKYSAVILAAGRSSRMGRPKALMELAGQSALARLAGLYRGQGVESLVVITGQWADEIAPAARKMGARAIHNPNHGRGMFSSITKGLSATGRAGAVFIHPVDIPLIAPETIKRLKEAFEAGRGEIIRPSFKMRLGHPPLIGRAVIPRILAWNGAGGLKGALGSLQDETVYLVVEDEAIMWDMDTPEDYQQLNARALEMEQEK